MLKKLQSPLLAAALSLGLSLLLGSVLCWRAALPLLELAATARPKPVDDKKAKGWDFWTIEVENLSTDLKEERARLRQQAEQQDQRAARLAAEQRELDKIRAGIDGLRQQREELGRAALVGDLRDEGGDRVALWDSEAFGPDLLL